MPAESVNRFTFAARLVVVLSIVAATQRAAVIDRAAAGEPTAPQFQTTLLAASGVPADELAHYNVKLDEIARACRAALPDADDAGSRVRAIHAFLHQRVLRGSYRASASDIGAALDGGPFNCAAASALLRRLATECGLKAQIMSVRGHVWCRVYDSGRKFDVETTCRRWFEIFDRYAGVPTRDVSPAVAEHRKRAARGRVLSEPQILAIFHYNRGVTLLREHDFAAAAEANRRALALDPDCRPALENLAAARQAARETAGLSAGQLP